MKTLDRSSYIFAVLFSCASAAAFAESVVSETTDKRILHTALEPACFGAGFDTGFFGAGLLPRQETNGFKDGAGGGALAEHFFNEPAGWHAGRAALTAASATYFFNGELALPAPVPSIWSAPPLLWGGPITTDEANQEEFHTGAGLEPKIKSLNDFILLEDGTCNGHGAGNRGHDFIVIRFGLKLRL